MVCVHIHTYCTGYIVVELYHIARACFTFHIVYSTHMVVNTIHCQLVAVIFNVRVKTNRMSWLSINVTYAAVFINLVLGSIGSFSYFYPSNYPSTSNTIIQHNADCKSLSYIYISIVRLFICIFLLLHSIIIYCNIPSGTIHSPMTTAVI